MKLVGLTLAISILATLSFSGCSDKGSQQLTASGTAQTGAEPQDSQTGSEAGGERDYDHDSKTGGSESTSVDKPAQQPHSRQQASDARQPADRPQPGDDESPTAETLEELADEARQDWEFEGPRHSLHRFESCDGLLAYHRSFALNDPWLYELEEEVETGHPLPTSDPHHIRMQSWQRLSARLKRVAESDKVQTDGTHIFSMTSNSLIVSKVLATGGTKRLAALQLTPPPEYAESDTALRNELLLSGEKLLIIRNWKNFYDDEDRYDPGEVQILEVDVGQANQPIILRQASIAHTLLLAAWRNGRQVHMAFWHTAPRIALHAAVDYRDADDPAEAARERNRALLNELRLESWHARYELLDVSSGDTTAGFLAACDSSFAPRQAPRRSGTTIVATVDPSVGIHRWRSTALLTDRYQLHATEETVYFARSDLIDGADAQIYQFTLSDDGALIHAGFSFHEGDLLFEQALDDHAGQLRVAFGQARSQAVGWAGEIVVLERVADASAKNAPRPMRRVGSMDGKQDNWAIRHVRYWDDVAYVTPWLWDEETRRRNPLHVIDLSRPEQPTLARTLILPRLAQNTYWTGDHPIPALRRHDLFPVGDGMAVVIGWPVGKTETSPLELVLSVFDLSNPLLPRLLQHSRTLGTFSMAEYDDRAVLIDSGRMWFPLDWIGCQDDERSTWLGIGVDPSGFAPQAIAISVAGCADGPPGVRAVLAGRQLHLVSRYEIRSFDPESGNELGVQALAQ